MAASVKAVEGRRSPRRWREGRARHSVRAVVVNLNASVSKRRRAEDCPPYPREASWSAPVLWRLEGRNRLQG